MIPARQVVWAALFLWLAAVLQGRVAHAIQFRGAQPDFVLIVLSCAASLVGGVRGTILGLWAGLLTVALVPGAFGAFLASRTIAGAFAGWLHRHVVRDSIVVPPLVVLAVTVAAEIVYVLMAPTHHPRQWLRAVGGEVLYNMVLAIPFYFALRLFRIGQPVEDPFALLS